MLGGCITRGPLIAPDLPSAARPSVELETTPFFPQTEFQCGPAALATVLAASGVDVTPDALTSQVYLPGRKGSLQIEMQAAPRRYGRIAYPLSRNLDAIVAELNANRPVLVLHNYGLPFWPRWHYAVVVGYDAGKDNVVLRSGTTRRQVLSAKNFMRAWDNGGRWALVMLRPGELPVMASASTYLEAAAAFERVASPADARLAFDAAVKKWPEQSLGWIGRGTAHYRLGLLDEAARDYSAALRLDPANAGARNNLGMTLLDLGCPARAREELDQIQVDSLTDPLRAAVLDTRQRLEASLVKAPAAGSSACTAWAR
ncbi:MAG: PA2778 family cysteine peptidase [Steroidobacteraceae bacterium]|nr:PA2778 family cysteine peptidase [Steroidobacteraceae bacterium]